MKKVYSLSFILLMTSCLTLFAQTKSADTQISWGEKSKLDKRSFMSDILGEDESAIYTLVSHFGGILRPGNIEIEKYDHDLKKIISNELDLSYEKKDLVFEDLLMIDNQLYLFTSFVNKSTDINYFFYQQIDKTSLKIKGEVNLICEIDFSKAKKKKSNTGNFNVEVSADRSKVLVFYNLPYDKNEVERFQYKVFQNDMTMLYENSIELEYKDKLFGLYDYLVSDAGDLYILGKNFNDVAKDEVKTKPNYKFSIFRYGDGSNVASEYTLESHERFLTECKLKLTGAGDLICAGFYSEKDVSHVGGTFLLKINGESKAVMSETFEDFELEFITQNLTEKQEKKVQKKSDKGKNVDLFQYDLDDIIIRDDGGAVLVGEQYFVRVTTTTSTNSQGQTTTRTIYHYYYNDIIIISFSPDGAIEWKEKIAKSQHTINDSGYFSSYVVMVDKDKLRFIFNDNGANLTYKHGDAPYTFNANLKNSIVTMATVDNRGFIKREALFNSKEIGILTRPKVCEQISDNTLILYGQRKKDYRLAKAIF